MHEDPQVPHYGKAGRGIRLQEGMVITVEPMINVGAWKAKIDDNGWTARSDRRQEVLSIRTYDGYCRFARFDFNGSRCR